MHVYLLHAQSMYIYSLLQSLPQPHSQTVTEYVHSTITAALRSDLLAGHLQRLQYLEALGENFSCGELALWRQLPLSEYYICVPCTAHAQSIVYSVAVIQYCVSVIEMCYKEKR